MHHPYYRTLWVYLQVHEHERIAALLERGRQLNMANLIAMAFNDPKKLQDEFHRYRSDLGATPSPEEALDNAQDVIEAMRRIDAGELTTTVITPGATRPAGRVAGVGVDG